MASVRVESRPARCRLVKSSPPAREKLLHAHAVQYRSAGFPVGVFHFAVFHVERVPCRGGSVNELTGDLLVVERDVRPHILKRVGNLAEQPMNRLQTARRHLVDAVLDGVAVSEIGDPDFGTDLPDALDAAFPLLKPSWVPGKVNIDERAETLELQPL